VRKLCHNRICVFRMLKSCVRVKLIRDFAFFLFISHTYQSLHHNRLSSRREYTKRLHNVNAQTDIVCIYAEYTRVYSGIITSCPNKTTNRRQIKLCSLLLRLLCNLAFTEPTSVCNLLPNDITRYRVIRFNGLQARLFFNCAALT